MAEDLLPQTTADMVPLASSSSSSSSRCRSPPTPSYSPPPPPIPFLPPPPRPLLSMGLGWVGGWVWARGGGGSRRRRRRRSSRWFNDGNLDRSRCPPLITSAFFLFFSFFSFFLSTDTTVMRRERATRSVPTGGPRWSATFFVFFFLRGPGGRFFLPSWTRAAEGRFPSSTRSGSMWVPCQW